MTELWVDKRVTEYKPYKLDDPLPLNAIPQRLSVAEAGRMEVSGKLTAFFADERLLRRMFYRRKSRGWRKHLRKNKP